MATVMSCGTGDWTGPLPGDPDNNSILSAVPAFGGIDVSWTYPNINPHAVAHVLLYRGISSNYAASVKQATVAGNTFYDKITGTAGMRYYYWIQIVSVNGTVGAAIGPASAIARSRIEDTIIDLSGKIESSALGVALRGSIGNITTNYNELLGKINTFSGNNAAFMAALSQVQSGLTGAVTLLNTEVTQRTSGQNALLSQQTVLAALNQVNVAAILEEQTVRVTADSALAQNISDLEVANTAGIAAAVKTLESSKIGYSGKVTTEEPYEGDNIFIVYPSNKYPAETFPEYASNRKRIIDKQGVINWNAAATNTQKLVWVVGLPLAQAVKSVGISDGTGYLTIEERATAQKLTNGTLLGKYTVKIDQGGRVAGFGLASSTNLKDGTTSAFAVNADTFSVSRPLSFAQKTIPTATAIGQTWFNENNQKIYKARIVGANEIKSTEWILDIPRYPFIVDTVSGDVYIDQAVVNKLTFEKITDSSGNAVIQDGKYRANYALDSEGGFYTGTIGRNATTGVATGTGVAVTGRGIEAAVNGKSTFKLDGVTGNATFGGKLTANAIDAVNTINIKDQAITFTVGAYAISTIAAGSVNTAANHDIITATIECTGASVNVHVSFFCRPAGDIDGRKGTDHTWYAKITRELLSPTNTITSTEIISTGWIGYARVRQTNTYGWGLGACGFNVKDSPGKGKVRYTVKVYNSEGDVGLSVYHRSMLLSELKK